MPEINDISNADNGVSSTVETTWKKLPIFVFLQDVRKVLKMDALGSEILRIAFPAAVALAADPIASLIDTVFIGRLGAVEIGAVGVSIAIFNQASKVTIFPLVSITTSFVAEEDTAERLSRESVNSDSNHDEKSTNLPQISVVVTQVEELNKGNQERKEDVEGINVHENIELKELKQENDTPTDSENSSIASENKGLMVENAHYKAGTYRRHIPSASTALVIGLVLGLLQTIFLISLAKPLLGIMGVKSGSPMFKPAEKYLTLRSLGAPAVLLSLAMQGVFRGFKDTTTPLYATGDVLNIILDPILIFACDLGVSGAAIAHVISQYLILLILFYQLVKQVIFLPPSFKNLQLTRFLKNGSMLLARVIAATSCVTLATSMAARLGSTHMAAFQVCLQVWLTSSLLADGLAVAAQAIIACAFAEKNYDKATRAAARVLQMGFVLGFGLAIVVGLGLEFRSSIFSKDKAVLHTISIGVPFVAGTQPLNSIAFVFDGVNFGASDFFYSAYTMVLVAIVSIATLFLLSKSNGFVGIWLALTIYMALRTLAGIWRMGTGTGPWRFLKGKLLP